MTEERFNRDEYLEYCKNSKVISFEELAVIGVVIVLFLSFLDLFLTLYQIYTGPFQDQNPFAKIIIEMGMPELLIMLKAFAGIFFAYVCIKYRELLITQVGVAFACLAHILLMSYWTVVF